MQGMVRLEQVPFLSETDRPERFVENPRVESPLAQTPESQGIQHRGDAGGDDLPVMRQGRG